MEELLKQMIAESLMNEVDTQDLTEKEREAFEALLEGLIEVEEDEKIEEDNDEEVCVEFSEELAKETVEMILLHKVKVDSIKRLSTAGIRMEALSLCGEDLSIEEITEEIKDILLNYILEAVKKNEGEAELKNPVTNEIFKKEFVCFDTEEILDELKVVAEIDILGEYEAFQSLVLILIEDEEKKSAIEREFKKFIIEKITDKLKEILLETVEKLDSEVMELQRVLGARERVIRNFKNKL